jgi:hypothetical protein
MLKDHLPAAERHTKSYIHRHNLHTRGILNSKVMQLLSFSLCPSVQEPLSAGLIPTAAGTCRNVHVNLWVCTASLLRLLQLLHSLLLPC